MNKIKGLPIFLPGRFYYCVCVTCNAKPFFNFSDAFYKTFYPLELDNIGERNECRFADGHDYYILSIPIGDKPLMKFMLEGTFNAQLTDMNEPSIKEKNVMLIRFLPKDKSPGNIISTALGLWQTRRYYECYLCLGDRTYFDLFSLFLSLRCRLSLQRKDVKDAETILGHTQVYQQYHERVNGKDSEQYGIAVILDALAVVWVGGCFRIAKKKMEIALGILEPLNSSFVGFIHYSLGSYETSLGNSAAAFNHLKKTDRRRFHNIAYKYFGASRYAYANWFAGQAFMDQPNKKTIILWAGILWKLDNRRLVRRLLCIDGAKEFKDTFKDLKEIEPSNERICCNCGKDGDALFFLRCPNCEKDWYCSQTCIDAHAERHRPICSWCSNCDAKLGKGQRQWCSGCRTIFYCGAECQLSHWKREHRHDCLKGITSQSQKETIISNATKVMKHFFQIGAAKEAKLFADAIRAYDEGTITREHLSWVAREIDASLKSKGKKY